MSDNDLSAPGTATYSSNTIHVGDGTWDNGRDSFLLPNLVGLNFDTMRYNGMGNRFRDLPEYHRLITGHGVLAAITFLFVLPLAIYSAKFGISKNRRKSMKIHVYCQILVLLLSTIILVLGWFAVGPRRSLSNPHHGIGVAIYTLIWAQFLFGWIMSKIEKRRKNPYIKRIPLKVWLHRLSGRTIALLGIIQIALGLTLYGSPRWLFIVYALVTAFLLIMYLALDRAHFESIPIGSSSEEYYSEYGSYLSGSRTQLTGDSRRRRPSEEKEKSHWARNLLAAGGIFGIYEAFKHRREKKREEREHEDSSRHRRNEDFENGSYGPSTTMTGRPTSAGETDYDRGHRSSSRRRPPSRPRGDDDLSTQSWENEKYEKPHTWRDRILGVGAGIAAIEGARRLFGRKKEDPPRRDDYRPPLGGNQSFVTQTDVSRVQNGQAPFSPGTPGGRVRPDISTTTPSRPSRFQHSQGDMSDDDDDSLGTPPGKQHHEESHTLRDSIATFGAIAGFREWNKRRRGRREQERTDRLRRQELQNEENFNRRTSNNYPRPQDAGHGRRGSYSETLMTGDTATAVPDQGHNNGNYGQSSRPSDLNTMQPPLPAFAGDVGSAAYDSRSNFVPALPPPLPLHGATSQELSNVYSLPPPPPGPAPGAGRPANYQPPLPGSAQMPIGAVNPDPSRLISHDHLVAESAAVGAAAALGAAAASAARRQSPSPSPYRNRANRRGSDGTAASSAYPITSNNGRTQSAASPPISLKMQVHNDGRHVTLRRLNEEEAAAERAARRPDRNQRYGRTPSLSSAADNSSIGPAARYGRHGPVRRSSDQPIVNIPVPPPMSSSAGRPSEVNLPGRPAATASPSSHRPSPRPPTSTTNVTAGIGSGLSGGFGSPGDVETGTDVSAFADNRRRRRAERARRLEAARGTGNNNRVEFE